MFKVQSIKIDGFWGKGKASSVFRSDVNIIIGKNGTGKTTFMNIMHAVLAVDLDALYDNHFETVHILLSDGKRNRKISATRVHHENSILPAIEYKISNRKFVVHLIGIEEARGFLPSLKRRAAESAQDVKNELNKMVSLASLSVYRLGGDADPEMRERNQRRVLSPVDQRLLNLTQRLTQYQLELSNEARKISVDLQRDVLISLLYSSANAKPAQYPLIFEVEMERKNLLLAYKQLGVSGSEVAKKIQEHISSVAEAVEKLKEFSANSSSSGNDIDLSALEASSRTRTVVDLSLSSEKKTKNLFSQIYLFIDILRQFISDKNFTFEFGELKVEGKNAITLAKLSSGEKQLLILFIETLLQRRKPYIFLADEPELSLHISWQRNIISAIKSINPEAQIIVATHSPEIAGKYKSAILDMEDIRHA